MSNLSRKKSANESIMKIISSCSPDQKRRFDFKVFFGLNVLHKIYINLLNLKSGFGTVK